MSTHLPIRITRRLHRQCIFQRPTVRQFSSTVARHRARGHLDQVQAEAAATRQGQDAPAPSAQYSQAQTEERNFPDDMGLISGTFIREPWSKMLSRLWTRDKGNNERFSLLSYLRYERKWATAKVQNVASNVNYWWGKKPHPACFFFWRAPLNYTAANIYRNVYNAFVKKDYVKISELCTTGLKHDFYRRIHHRGAKVNMEWKIIGSPKTRVVSNKVAMIDVPGWTDTGFRQVVVRVQSRQSLEITYTASSQQDETPIIKTKRRPQAWTPGSAWTAQGAHSKKEESAVDNALEDAPGSSVFSKKQRVSREEVVVEYMVLQKHITKGGEGPWMIWGFASPTTLDTIAADDLAQKKAMEYRVQNLTSA